jgi:hypothetical protein
MSAHDVSVELTRTILGIDALYRAGRSGGSDKLDTEGLVPVHWSPLPAVEVSDWRDARARLAAIVARAATLPDPYERDWLTEQGLATSTMARWLGGEVLAYEEQVAGLLRVDPTPPAAAAIEAARARRDAAVRRAGFPSYAAHAEARRVAPGDVGAVTQELITEARTRTEAHLPHLRLPPDTIGVKTVSGTAFSAYCDYPGRRVWINTDVPMTRATLKHLVGHEAYPGHDAHMGHRDALVREGRMLPDAALVVTNTASSVLFEGIAERALDLIGWREGDEDAIAWHHDRLEWLASIEVAHGLNTGRMSAGEAAAFLRDTCDADEAWIDAKIRFVTHPIRAPFVYAYWWGGTVVGRLWARVRAPLVPSAISHLYDRMHTPSTLLAHWTDTQEDPDAV